VGLTWHLVTALGLLLLIGTLLMVTGYPGTQFGVIRLIAWVCFVNIPVYLLGMAVIFRVRYPKCALVCLTLATIIFLSGMDAFFIEPHWLAVNRISIRSPDLFDPIRVVLIADIQTDHIGRYEQRVLTTVLKQKPDLLLFAGDYIHLGWQSDGYEDEIDRLNALLKEFDFNLPFGAYAIAGNVDNPVIWSRVFESSSIQIIGDTESYDLGPIHLTGLALHDSFDTSVYVPQKDKFHIVLGHSPNFSLGDVEADLLLAGHTHGGQVQIPFIGPILTLSAVPHSWASGVTEISPGKTLIVSRGVGLERMDAPRMRFFCRPEIIVLDLVPA
jgi:predicted MPP superfamily phosphohydrolase